MLRPYVTSGDKLDRGFDEGLGLRARDECGGRDEEIEAVELAVTSDVGRGLMSEAALEVGLEAGGGGRFEALAEAGEEVGAGGGGGPSPPSPPPPPRGGG